MIPASEICIVVEPEIHGAQAWAERHGISSVWSADTLELHTVLIQAGESTKFYLRGRFDNYRALAPEWTFTDETWVSVGRLTDFPRPITQPPPPTASIFLNFQSRGVICAPFNRLAYASGSGPHQDWGGPEQWLEASNKASAARQVRADTVGDMLQVIRRDFFLTRGRMG
jgi:hypothetical protein